MELPSPNSLRFEPCPTSGEGVHFWFLAQANRCQIGGLSESATEILLREASRACGRRVPDREIQAAVRKAYSSARPAGATRQKRPGVQPPVPLTRISRDEEQIRSIISGSGEGLADLWEDSEIRLEDAQPLTEIIIDALFPGDPLLCVARKLPEDCTTQPRSAWRGQLSACALIVPSPMSTPTGISQEGRQSTRCLDNTGPRRFLVVEFDSGTFDAQAALLLHLGRYAPLVLAVHSRGKSLHGWFAVESQIEPRVDRFFRYAVTLGADPSHWTRCQLTRMPDGTRVTGARQTVFFFSPSLAHA